MMNTELNHKIREAVNDRNVEEVRKIYTSNKCKEAIAKGNLFTRYFFAKCQLESEIKEKRSSKRL